MSSAADAIRIFEVGPRDGLQNEKQIVSLADKIWLIESLAASGIKDIEAGAFVRGDKVPQMADSDSVLKHFQTHRSSAALWSLVPNLKGLERALQIGVEHIAVFTAVSNTFNQKNIGMTVDESFREIEQVVKEAKKANIQVRGYVSTVWGCPFEGKIKASQALSVLERMLDLSVDQLSVGDTIGIASPKGVEEIFRPLLKQHSADRIAAHFHDTRGTALANALRSFELGIRSFDSSLGGLGGCPFAPGASGNLATEDLVYLFKEMDVQTHVDYPKLCQTSIELSKRMGGRSLQSRALKAFQTNCTVKNEWDI